MKLNSNIGLREELNKEKYDLSSYQVDLICKAVRIRVSATRKELIEEVEREMQPAFDDFTKAGKLLIQTKGFANSGNEVIENIGYMKGVLQRAKLEKLKVH